MFPQLFFPPRSSCICENEDIIFKIMSEVCSFFSSAVRVAFEWACLHSACFDMMCLCVCVDRRSRLIAASQKKKRSTIFTSKSSSS